MKIFTAIVLWVLAVSVALAQTIDFSNGGGGEATGDYLDEATESGITTNVYEIPGLRITARAGAAGQKINTTSTSMGVTVFGSGDDTDRFDSGESMKFSFDKQVQITKLDFVGYESNSVFIVSVDGQPDLSIGYDDLPNKTSQFILTNILVDAETEIDFYVGNTNSVIGLQSMDVTVLGGAGDLTLSIAASNGMSFVFAAFDGAATTNYVLQSSTNLTTNVWNTVSAAFAGDTNILIEAEHSVGFYRVVPN